jgi:hypothetical protein
MYLKMLLTSILWRVTKHKEITMMEHLTYISLHVVCPVQHVNYKHAHWPQSDIAKHDFHILAKFYGHMFKTITLSHCSNKMKKEQNVYFSDINAACLTFHTHASTIIM